MYRNRLNLLIKLLREYEYHADAHDDGDGVRAAIDMGCRVTRERDQIIRAVESVAPQHNPVLTAPLAQALRERLTA